MTRAQFQALPAEQALSCLLKVVDYQEFDSLAALKEATEGGHDFDWVRSDIQRTNSRLSMLARVHEAGPEAIGVMVREMAAIHPESAELIAELAQVRDERVGVVIDSIIADLDSLPDPPAAPLRLVAEEETVAATKTETSAPARRRGFWARLRR